MSKWESSLNKELSTRIGQKTQLACPDCGAVMCVRHTKYSNSYFLGCHRYPECRHTMEIPEALRLEILGFKQLPGFSVQ